MNHMATEREQFDESDDDQLAWLLTSGYAAPEMRPEFARALGERLDGEFAAAQPIAGPMNGKAGKWRVGAAKPRTAWRRPMKIVATAASLLLAASILMDPPAWANVLRTIVERIEAFTVGGGDGGEQAAAGDAPVELENMPQVAPAPQGGAIGAINQAPVEAVEIIEATKPPIKTSVKTANDAGLAVAPPADVVAVRGWKPFEEPLAPGELSRRMDEQLVALWQANGIRPVGPASDAEFMRRVYLDLTGRIPSVSEARSFLDDPSPNRRELLVERLLEHRDHATHLAAVWRGILLPPDVDLTRLGGPAKFEEWLAERFAANVPYDKIVTELLLAEGRVSESGPLLFYAALKLNPEELAARTSRAFLGTRMECAQCHDHFFDKISQHDFWSFAAFFAQISRPRGKMEMTSPVLAVRDNDEGEVTIPDTDQVVPPRLPSSAVALEDKPNDPPRREQLARWLVSPTNGQFARATVNRVWAHLFGRGLVEPVDDMRPDNRPIAPEVLDTLSRDFAASGFDLRRLLRELALTNAYQLTSRSEESDPSRTLHFAQMNIKSFTAEQLYDCISVAAGRSVHPAGMVDGLGIERFSDFGRQSFVAQFRAPAGQVTDYQAGIPQALTLMHGGLIHSATDLGSSGLLKSLAAPFFTDDQRLDTLFLSTLSRYPTDAEREVMRGSIAAAANAQERQQALGDVLWALLNSAEFTLNH